jgi:hypothetical protein
MKKTLLSALMLFTLSSTLFANKDLPQSNDPAAQTKADQQLKLQNKKIISLVVEEVGKTLPQKVDEYTQYVSIKSEGLKLVSTFEINTGSKSDEAVIKEDKARMQDIISTGVCKNSKRFLESNIDVAYAYVSEKTKKLLFRFDLTKQDCIALWNKKY